MLRAFPTEWVRGYAGQFTLLYVASGALVWVAALLSAAMAIPGYDPPSLAERLTSMDGRHYARIVDQGYEFDPDDRSTVAFFPAYPLTARGTKELTGLTTNAALLVVSNGFQFAAGIALGAYLAQRNCGDFGVLAATARSWTLIAFAFLPATFFFRTGHSETTFLAAAILTLLAVERGWPNLFVALLAGAATGARSVGVALVPVVAWHIWRTSPTWRCAAGQLAWAVPLSCWGLASFMVFQFAAFGEPFAFVRAQDFWTFRMPLGLWEKMLALFTWEPIWSVYDSESVAYWTRPGRADRAAFSLQFANPLYFVGTCALIAIGWSRRWLTAYEVMLSAGLLAIPYGLRGYEMCMNSQARFAAVVFPVYIVLGQILARAPLALTTALTALAAAWLFIYAFLFCAGWSLF